jgi:hypothetical protein
MRSPELFALEASPLLKLAGQDEQRASEHLAYEWAAVRCVELVEAGDPVLGLPGDISPNLRVWIYGLGEMGGSAAQDTLGGIGAGRIG